MTDPNKRATGRKRLLIWMLVCAAALLFVSANVHLLYVAFASQPDCVPHLKENDGGGKFRAAKSAC